MAVISSGKGSSLSARVRANSMGRTISPVATPHATGPTENNNLSSSNTPTGVSANALGTTEDGFLFPDPLRDTMCLFLVLMLFPKWLAIVVFILRLIADLPTDSEFDPLIPGVLTLSKAKVMRVSLALLQKVYHRLRLGNNSSSTLHQSFRVLMESPAVVDLDSPIHTPFSNVQCYDPRTGVLSPSPHKNDLSVKSLLHWLTKKFAVHAFIAMLVSLLTPHAWPYINIFANAVVCGSLAGRARISLRDTSRDVSNIYSASIFHATIVSVIYLILAGLIVKLTPHSMLFFADQLPKSVILERLLAPLGPAISVYRSEKTVPGGNVLVHSQPQYPFLGMIVYLQREFKLRTIVDFVMRSFTDLVQYKHSMGSFGVFTVLQADRLLSFCAVLAVQILDLVYYFILLHFCILCLEPSVNALIRYLLWRIPMPKASKEWLWETLYEETESVIDEHCDEKEVMLFRPNQIRDTRSELMDLATTTGKLNTNSNSHLSSFSKLKVSYNYSTSTDRLTDQGETPDISREPGISELGELLLLDQTIFPRTGSCLTIPVLLQDRLPTVSFYAANICDRPVRLRNCYYADEQNNIHVFSYDGNNPKSWRRVLRQARTDVVEGYLPPSILKEVHESVTSMVNLERYLSGKTTEKCHVVGTDATVMASIFRVLSDGKLYLHPGSVLAAAYVRLDGNNHSIQMNSSPVLTLLSSRKRQCELNGPYLPQSSLTAKRLLAVRQNAPVMSFLGALRLLTENVFSGNKSSELSMMKIIGNPETHSGTEKETNFGIQGCLFASYISQTIVCIELEIWMFGGSLDFDRDLRILVNGMEWPMVLIGEKQVPTSSNDKTNSVDECDTQVSHRIINLVVASLESGSNYCITVELFSPAIFSQTIRVVTASEDGNEDLTGSVEPQNIETTIAKSFDTFTKRLTQLRNELKSIRKEHTKNINNLTKDIESLRTKDFMMNGEKAQKTKQGIESNLKHIEEDLGQHHDRIVQLEKETSAKLSELDKERAIVEDLERNYKDAKLKMDKESKALKQSLKIDVLELEVKNMLARKEKSKSRIRKVQAATSKPELHDKQDIETALDALQNDLIGKIMTSREAETKRREVELHKKEEELKTKLESVRERKQVIFQLRNHINAKNLMSED